MMIMMIIIIITIERLWSCACQTRTDTLPNNMIIIIRIILVIIMIILTIRIIVITLES